MKSEDGNRCERPSGPLLAARFIFHCWAGMGAEHSPCLEHGVGPAGTFTTRKTEHAPHLLPTTVQSSWRHSCLGINFSCGKAPWVVATMAGSSHEVMAPQKICAKASCADIRRPKVYEVSLFGSVTVGDQKASSRSYHSGMIHRETGLKLIIGGNK